MSLRRLGLLFALPTVVGLSLAACGTEDDAAPGPSGGKGGAAAGAGDTGGTTGGTGDMGGNGGTGETGGTDAEAGMGGEPNAGDAGSGGEAGEGGAGGAGTGGHAGTGGSHAGAGGSGGSGGNGGNGGSGGAPLCHTVISGFDTDPGGSMGKYVTGSATNTGSTTVTWSSTEGVIAPGAGKLNATFADYNDQAQLSLYFGHANWTCVTKLHAMVKLISATDLSHVKSVAFNINSGTATARYSAHNTSTAGFAMDTWYPIELPFATASYQNPANTLPDFTDVVSIGIQIQTVTATTATLPVTTVMYVDDIWLE